MYELFYRYLITHHRVGLPGMGYFFVESLLARIDSENGLLTPPTPFINFKSGNVSTDNNLYVYLAKEMQVTEASALSKFNDFSLQVNHASFDENGIVLPGIGILKQNGNDSGISFTTAENTNEFLPAIALSDSFIEGAGLKKQTVSQEAEWWIYAAILALVGIGALLYRYYTLE